MSASRFACIFALLGLSAGSHFRYGTISWVPLAGNGVEFTFLTAWRRSYWPGTGIDGDGYVVAGEQFEVPSGGKANRWYYGDSDGPDLVVTVTRPSEKDMDYLLDNALGRSVMSHSYPSPTNNENPWLAGYTGCCRLDANQVGDPSGDKEDGLNNNGGRKWDVRTKVDLSGGPLAIMKDKSPSAVGGKPILRLRMDTVEKFDIVVIDPDDDPLTWRMAVAEEMGDPDNKQPGWGNNLLRPAAPYNAAPMTEANKMSIENKIVINLRGEEVRFGEAAWDTTGLHTGYWQSTVMIHALNAEVPYDFLLLVKDPKGNDPPVWDSGPDKTPLPEDSLEVVCNSGSLMYTMLAVDSGPDDEIDIYKVNEPPAGMVHEPMVGLGSNGFRNPVQQVVSWSPSCMMRGKTVLCYQATDTNLVQQLDSRVRCVIIAVTEITNKKPYFCDSPQEEPCADKELCKTPINGQQIPVCVGRMVRFKVEVCDDNEEDRVSIDFVSGKPFDSVITQEVAPFAYPKYPLKNHVRRTFNLNPQQSLEDGDICFEGIDFPPKDGPSSNQLSTGLRCVKLTVRYPPRFIDPTPLADTENGGGNARFIVQVCKETSFTVASDDRNDDPDEDVTIFVMEDPGIPNGAVVSDNQCPPPVNNERVRCNPVSRAFSWTPVKAQAGKTFRVCFIARDNKDNCQKGGYYSQATTNPCIDLSVVNPEPQWSDTTFDDGKQITVHVGCQHTHTVECRDTATVDRPLYEVEVHSTELPEGASLSQCKGIAGDVDEVDKSFCSKSMSWRPVRGQEGKTYTLCYHCSDVGCDAVLHDGLNQRDLPVMAFTDKRCATITVARCKYCVQDGDTLVNINKFYHLDTNWLRLWNANGNAPHANPIHDPDMSLMDGQILNIGPVYRVQSGDTVVALAARFHTTVKKLMTVNPDMESDARQLRPGREVCVMPCTDTPSGASETYQYAY